jgi:hypothetical protein
VTIIVLNWNGLMDTLDCLASLAVLEYPNFEIVVVDNGSTDGSVGVIRGRFPRVQVIENSENLGYTGGNNTGLRYAWTNGADYTLLLNNDTQVAPDFLCRMIAATEVEPIIGVAGPTIYYHARPELIWSAGGAIDWRRGKTWMLGLNTGDVGQLGSEPRQVDFVTGCALLVKRSVVDRVGLLDERFFAYYEEAEWCVRARRAGFRVIHVPQAKVWHKIPLDAREDSPVVHYYITRNRLLFLKVAKAGWQAWFHTLLVEYLRTLLSWSLRPRWRHKHQHRRAMVQAISDAMRGRWGHRATMHGIT